MVYKIKKAQMEVFGLAIVVILIFIGIVFVIKFYKPASTEDIKSKYVDEVIAQNMLTSIFSLNTTCSLDMAELAKDCYLDGSYLCGSKRSCEYVNDTISNILENTLEEWKKPYEFYISGTDINKTYGNCSRLKKVPGQYIISLYPEKKGSVTARLDICRS